MRAIAIDYIPTQWVWFTKKDYYCEHPQDALTIDIGDQEDGPQVICEACDHDVTSQNMALVDEAISTLSGFYPGD